MSCFGFEIVLNYIVLKKSSEANAFFEDKSSSIYLIIIREIVPYDNINRK